MPGRRPLPPALAPPSPPRSALSPLTRARMGAPWMPPGRRGHACRPPRPSNRPTAPRWSLPPRSPVRPRRAPAAASAPHSSPSLSRGARRVTASPPLVSSSGPSLGRSLRHEKIYLRKYLKQQKIRMLIKPCELKTSPNRRGATLTGVMAGTATTGVTARTPDNDIFPRANQQHF